MAKQTADKTKAIQLEAEAQIQPEVAPTVSQESTPAFVPAVHYPTWLYHKTEKAALVQSESEHAELLKKFGPGWEDSPEKFGVETHPAAQA